MSDLVSIAKQTLTASQYSDLADVPPEVEWLANITNAKTRRLYKSDVAEFFIFTRRLHCFVWAMPSAILKGPSIALPTIAAPGPPPISRRSRSTSSIPAS